MRRVALGCALALLSLAACGGSPDTAPSGRVLSAAGKAGSQVQDPPPTTAPAVVSTVAPPTTVGGPPVVSDSSGGDERYSPPPPPAGVEPDGYGGYGGTATVTGNGTTVTLSVYPREQYLGEMVQVRVHVEGTTAVRAVRIDFGDGTTFDDTPLPTWACPEGSRETWGGAPAHTYAAAGVYRIAVTVTAVPCSITPPPPGGWTLPNGQPAVGMPSSWIPTGPDQVLSTAIDLTQRPDPPPPPDGPPPGP